jgi:hypothetical protein
VRQQFKITYLDGNTVNASAGLADQVAYEREFDRSIAELASNFRITDICWLAWHGLKRGDGSVAEFDTWIDTVETVEALEDEGIVPLETAQHTG